MVALIIASTLETIKSNIKNESHVVISEAQLSIHNFIISDYLERVILPSYFNVYTKLREVCKSMALITCEYFSECSVLNSTYIRELQLQLKDNVVLEDFEAVMNFYMCTFLYLANDQMVTANVCTSSSLTTLVETETDRGLYCLSGGTLCDIIKLCNRRMS